jgi:hypothetical protein
VSADDPLPYLYRTGLYLTKRHPARGTSEPNYEAGGGKFGVVVGDPVVSNTTARLPGARGYPVQASN